MKLLLVRLGNSTGLRLPAAVLKQLGVQLGDELDAQFTKDGKSLLLKPVIPQRKYTLEELLAKCDPSAPIPQGIDAWEEVAPAGNEPW